MGGLRGARRPPAPCPTAAWLRATPQKGDEEICPTPLGQNGAALQNEPRTTAPPGAGASVTTGSVTGPRMVKTSPAAPSAPPTP